MRLSLILTSCALVIALIVLFCANLGQLPFDGDESWFIASSSAFEALVSGDAASPVWNENAVTLSHPPGARYLIALGRLIGGYSRADLNQLYDYRQSPAVNQAQGRIPTAGLLWWSRLPMALIGAVCGLLIALVAYQVGGNSAAICALLLYAGNAYVRNVVGHAMGEAPLLCALLLATVVGFRAIDAWDRLAPTSDAGMRQSRSVAGWFALFGVCCGLAGLVKINGLLVAGAGVVICALLVYTPSGKIHPAMRSSFVLRTSVTMLVAALGVFVLCNPYLYPDIIGRTGGMFLYRAADMQYQQQVFPDAVLPSMVARLTWSWWQITSDNAALRFPGAWLLNGTLLIIGLWQLLHTTWQRWAVRRGPGGPDFCCSYSSSVAGQ